MARIVTHPIWRSILLLAAVLGAYAVMAWAAAAWAADHRYVRDGRSVQSKCFPDGVCVKREPAPAQIRRVVNVHPGGNSAATGTIVHDDGRTAIVMTCWHLVRDGVGRLVVCGPKGEVDGRLLDTDQAADLSAIAIPSQGLGILQIADRPPRVGENVVAAGFGPDCVYQTSTGPILHYGTTAGNSSPDLIVFRGRIRVGDSGGPILDALGRIIGVFWADDSPSTAHTGRIVTGTCLPRLRAFLSRVIDRLHRQRPLPGPTSAGNGPPRPTRPLPGPVSDPPPQVYEPRPNGPAPSAGDWEPIESAAAADPVTPQSSTPAAGDRSQALEGSAAEGSTSAGNGSDQAAPAGTTESSAGDDAGFDWLGFLTTWGPIVLGATGVGASIPAGLYASKWSGRLAVGIGRWLIRRRRDKAHQAPSTSAPTESAAGSTCQAGEYFDRLKADLAATDGDASQQVDQWKSRCEQLAGDLEAARLEIAAWKQKAEERPVRYLTPAADDGLDRMRRAMRDVSNVYKPARPWVQMIEKAYTLLLSGDHVHGS